MGPPTLNGHLSKRSRGSIDLYRLRAIRVDGGRVLLWSLLMAEPVKNQAVGGAAYRRGAGQTRISAKHQVTIPLSAFTDAGFKPGDVVRAKAIGPGRVVLTRQDALLDEFSGALSSNGVLRQTIEQLRDEWA